MTIQDQLNEITKKIDKLPILYPGKEFFNVREASAFTGMGEGILRRDYELIKGKPRIGKIIYTIDELRAYMKKYT